MADPVDGPSTFRCPYCQTLEAMVEPVQCQGCSAVYHLDCWTENGGCAVPGCSYAPRPGEDSHSYAAAASAPASVPQQFAPSANVSHTYPTTGSPAGWYLDPMSSANLRYWNGFQWTESIAPR